MKTVTIEIRELGGPFREVYSGDIGLATGADGSPPPDLNLSLTITGRFIRISSADWPEHNNLADLIGYGPTFNEDFGVSEVRFYAIPEPGMLELLIVGAMEVSATRKRWSCKRRSENAAVERAV